MVVEGGRAVHAEKEAGGKEGTRSCLASPSTPVSRGCSDVIKHSCQAGKHGRGLGV